jgi:hypothetical protein
MTTCPSDNMSTCIWTGFNRELVISASLWYKVDIIVISSKQLVFAMILQWPAKTKQKHNTIYIDTIIRKQT